MKALVLASGNASRLRPLSYITPKSLLDVKGKPVLAHILDGLDSSSFLEEILVLYGHDYEAQFMAFQRYYRYRKRLKFLSDRHKNHQEETGSIGSIAHVVRSEKIKDDLFVAGGDNLYDFRVDDFINFYENHGRKTSVAAYEFKYKAEVAGKYGVIELKDDSLGIAGFEEKPYNPKTSLAATLCYILSRNDLHHLDDRVFRENAGELIKHLVDSGQDVNAFVFRGKWFDIGTIEDLEKARREF